MALKAALRVLTTVQESLAVRGIFAASDGSPASRSSAAAAAPPGVCTGHAALDSARVAGAASPQESG
jgi:hypothetical protein